LGDSIAAGYGLSPGYAWPDLLINHLTETWPQRSWQLHNASIPGDTTPDAYVRFDDIRQQHPHLTIIALGINDCRRASSPVVARRIAYFYRNEQTWWGKNSLLRRLGLHLRPLDETTISSSDASQVPFDVFLSILGWMTEQIQAMGALPILLTLSPLAPWLKIRPIS